MSGTIIQGNYEILDRIGQGGMAVVYRARQISLDRIVAVKILSGSLEGTGDYVDRFRQEAMIVARLTHHNIVQVYDICDRDDNGGGLCIIMEYLDGEPLSKVLARERPLSLARALSIAGQIAAGLAYAHEKGVIHRDIKPANIMLLDDDRVKITDFGIARLCGSDLRTRTGATMGTPEYMSPEQAEGQPIDHRTDLYSLAVVLYAMLAGELPFSAESPVTVALKQVREQPRPPRSINPEIPEKIESVILRGMVKNPDERFQTAREFLVALAQISGVEVTETTLPTVQTEILPAPPTPRAATPPPPMPISMSAWKIRKAWRLDPTQKKLIAVGSIGMAGLIAALVLIFTGGLRGRIGPRELENLPLTELIARLERIREMDEGRARQIISEGESRLFRRFDDSFRGRGRGRPGGRPGDLRRFASREILPSLPEDARARWESMLNADGSTTAPIGRPAIRGRPGPSGGFAQSIDREVERVMRGLNDEVEQDAEKAREAFARAETTSRKLKEMPESGPKRMMVAQCIEDYVESVAHDSENWKYQAQLARFLVENVADRVRSRPVRNGILNDAGSLARKAMEGSPVPEQASVKSLLQSIEDSLNNPEQ